MNGVWELWSTHPWDQPLLASSECECFHLKVLWTCSGFWGWLLVWPCSFWGPKIKFPLWEVLHELYSLLLGRVWMLLPNLLQCIMWMGSSDFWCGITQSWFGIPALCLVSIDPEFDRSICHIVRQLYCLWQVWLVKCSIPRPQQLGGYKCKQKNSQRGSCPTQGRMFQKHSWNKWHTHTHKQTNKQTNNTTRSQKFLLGGSFGRNVDRIHHSTAAKEHSA